MTRLIIWRHGETDWNVTGRVQGYRDIDLNATGEQQTAAAAARLAARGPTRILSSDLRRAARGAEALSALTGLPIEFDARLRERDYGPWEGLVHAEIQALDPDSYARWGTGQELVTPGIESIDDLGKRVLGVLLEVAAQSPGGTVVLATHGGAARAGCGGLLGWPVPIWPTLSALRNCHVSELRLAPTRGWQLESHNVG
jgi:glucosyl-3-phosphoglycerate phosphatase